MKDVYEVLKQKELEASRLEEEVEALRVSAPSGGSDRVPQISSELLRLFNRQTEFWRKGARVSPDELHEYEKRRERIRELFGELSCLRKAV
jgi:hypothetical protein